MSVEFEESVEVRKNCPKCKGKKTVVRTVVKELQQKKKGRWYTEHCTECDYWNGGFT